MVPHDVSNGIFYTQNLFKPYFLFLFTNKSTVVKDASMFLHLLKNFFDEAVVKYTKYILTFDIEGVGKWTQIQLGFDPIVACHNWVWIAHGPVAYR